MSTTVDDRVVRMRFDNDNFERNVKHTMGTLDELKNALQFKNSNKGLDDLEQSSKKISFKGMTDGLNTFTRCMTKSEMICKGAMERIGAKITDTGMRITEALTIESPKDGFREYELKMGSVQTIMASTGESLEKVNGYLGDLNTYSDKTIYSFSDMTESIGKFTNAGVSLDDAVNAIKGISNEAALSGANANEASHAMYNFAQALSSGSVKLIDWKSIENANMATKEFKQELINTAVELNTLVKVGDEYKSVTVDNNGSTSDWFTSTKKFNDSLSSQWMTTEVLTETLKRYADETTDLGKRSYAAAQDVKTFSQLMDTLKEALGSGWAQTWELIIGDFDEAKVLFTKASDFFGGIIGNAADRRNSLIKNALDNVVQLSDWQTLQKAGIATDEFRKSIVDAAEAHGVSIKQMIRDEGSFDKTLEKGWLTSDILNDALKKNSEGVQVTTKKLKMSLDEVRKTASEELKANPRDAGLKQKMKDYEAIGDFIDNAYKKSGKNINDLSKKELVAMGVTKRQAKILKELGVTAQWVGTPMEDLNKKMERPSGRELLIESMYNVLEALKTSISAVRDAFEDIFPRKTSDEMHSTIEKITSAINTFTEKITKNQDNVDKLRRTFRGLFAVLDIIRTVIGGGFTAAFKILEGVLGSFDMDILDLTANIGDTLVAFRDWLKSDNILVQSLKAVGNGVGWLIKQVVSLVQAFTDLPVVQNTFEKTKTIAGKIRDVLSTMYDITAPLVKELYENLKGLDSLSFKNISKLLTDFANKMSDAFGAAFPLIQGFKDDMHDAKTATEGVTNGIMNVIKKFGDGFVSVFEFIKEKVSQINFGHIVTVGAGVGLFKTLKLFNRYASILEGFVGSIKGVFGAISGVFKSISGLLDTYSKKLKSEAMLNYAKSVIVLAGALYLIAKIDKDRLWSAVAAMGALMGMLMAFSLICGKVKGMDGTIKSLSGVITLTLSLLIFVRMLKQMESLDPKKAKENLGMIGFIMLEMVALMAASRLATRAKDTKNNALIQMGTSMLMFAVACRMLGNLDSTQLGQALLCVTTLGLIATAMLVVSKVSGKNSDKAGKMLVSMSGSLILMAVACRMLGNIKPEKMVGALTAITFIGLIYTALIAVSKLSGKYADKAGKMLIRIGGSLMLVAVACRMLGNMDKSDMDKALDAVKSLGMVFAALIVASNLTGSEADKAGKMLRKMTGLFIVMSLAIVVLGHIETDAISKGVTAIAGISLCFATLMKATGKMGRGTTQVKMIQTLAVTVALMAASLVGLSFIDTGALFGAVAALDLTMLCMGQMIKMSRKAGKATSGMIIMASSIALITGAIAVLANGNVQGAIQASLAISTLLLSFGASIKLINDVKITGSTVAALGLMIVAMGLITTLIWGIDQLNVQPSIQTAVAISALITAFSGATYILSKTQGSAFAAVKGALALDGVILAVGGLVVGIGALFDKMKGINLEGFLDTGLRVLIKLFNGIGEAVGSLVSGVFVGLASGLPEIGQYISDFWTNMQGFIQGVKSIDEGTIEGCLKLAEMLIIITAAELINGLANLIGFGKSSMSKFAEDIGTFATAINNFSSTVSGSNIDTEKVKAAAEAGKMLAEMCGALPREGGWLDKFIGTTDMEKFGTDIEKFGEAIVKFSAKVKGKIDTESVEAAANAGQMLSDLENNLKNHGGKLQELIGDSDLDSFGKQLEGFGAAMVTFSSKVSGKIDTGAVEAAANAGTMLSDLENSLKNHGGLLQGMVGDQTLFEFGCSLVSFSGHLVLFGEKIKGFDSTGLSKATSAANAMSALENGLPAHDGVVQAWVGDDDLEDFGGRLEAFASSLVTFGDTISGIKTGAVTYATTAAGMLSAIENGLGDKDGFWDRMTGSGSKDLGDLGEEIADLGEGISDFSDNVKNVDTERMSSIVDSVGGILTIAETSISMTETNKFTETLTALARSGIDGFKDTMCNSAGDIISAVKMFTEMFKVAIRDKWPELRTAGKNTAQGFINGIKDKIENGEVYAAGESIGQSALRGAMKALDEHSPSKEMYKVGAFAIDGFLNAIADGTGKVKTVANDIFKGFVDEATSITEVMKYAKGPVNQLVKMYSDGVKNIADAKTKGEKAISSFALKLYKNSDVYKEDKATIKQHTQDLKNLYKEQAKLKKQAGIQDKKDIKERNKRRKELEKQLKESIENDKKKTNKGFENMSAEDIAKEAEYKKQADAIENGTDIITDAIDKGKERLGLSEKSYEDKMKDFLANDPVKEQREKEKKAEQKAYDKKMKDFLANDPVKAAQEQKKAAEAQADAESATTKRLREQLKQLEVEGKTKSTEYKNIQKQLRQNAKDIKAKNKEIVEDGKQMAKNAKQVFKEFCDSIKDSVQEYANVFNSSLETGINLFEEMSDAAEDTEGSIKSVLDSLKDMLKSYMALSSVALDTGISLFEEFNANGEEQQRIDAVTSATDELTQSKSELATANSELAFAEKELARAQAKSNAVNGRSQVFLDDIVEKEKAVAEAKANVAEKSKAEAEAQKAVNEANADTRIQDTIKNMKSQVAGINELRKNLQTLAERGIDEGLLKSLKALGVQGFDQVKTFVKMTKSELEEANKVFKESSALTAQSLLDGFTEKITDVKKWGDSFKKLANLNLAKDVKEQLMKEFQEQGVDSSEYINAILGMSPSDLKKFETAYREYMETPGKVSQEIADLNKDSVEDTAEETKKTINDMLNNMKGNVDKYKEWKDNLKKLEESGINKGLLASLKNLGVEGAEQVRIFAQMSAEELKKANKYFKESGKMTSDALIDSMTSKIGDSETWSKNMKKFSKLKISKKVKEAIYDELVAKGVEGNEYLEAILNMDKTQLNTFVSKYKEYLEVPQKVANQVAASGAYIESDEYGIALDTLDAFLSKFNSKISKDLKKANERLQSGLTAGLTTGTTAVARVGGALASSAMTAVTNKVNKKSGKKAGDNVVAGLAAGLLSNDTAIQAATKLANGIMNTFTKKLGIHSPSRVFEQYGKYTTQGYANGLSAYSGAVSSATDKIADEAIQAMKDAIIAISSITEEDLNYEPTITPVVDLGDVKRGVHDINNMFDSSAMMYGVRGMANSISRNMSSSARSQNAVNNNAYDYSQQKIENVFHITGDNPKEIANEVSRVLQRQLNRKDAAWA